MLDPSLNTLKQNATIKHYQQVRQTSVDLCAPLEIEDMTVQPVSFVSPIKWHLAHTTWFFVNFIFHRFNVNYVWPDSHYPKLFNSYYKSQSEHWVQAQRGSLSRPTVREVLAFREEVDNAMMEWLESYNGDLPEELTTLLELGLQHEQQHQELLLMDIKYILWQNPGQPAYFSDRNHYKLTSITKQTHFEQNSSKQTWQHPGGLFEFGTDSNSSDFCFDNETPKHQAFLAPYSISTQLVSNREFCEFISDGGYQNPLFWLSEGWDFIKQQHINSPLYWHGDSQDCHIYTLSGLNELNPTAPVSHISFHEAYAYARWANKRLPSEYEWEHFAQHQPQIKPTTFLEHTLSGSNTLAQNQPNATVHGGLWEWTSSSYSAYPGYDASRDAFGEYNGKFMINQIVLRGHLMACALLGPVNR